jgi:hypothetical protein
MAPQKRRRTLPRDSHVPRALSDSRSQLLAKACSLSPGIASTLHNLRCYRAPHDLIWLVVAVALYTCDSRTFSTLDSVETFAGEHRVTKAFVSKGFLTISSRRTS